MENTPCGWNDPYGLCKPEEPPSGEDLLKLMINALRRQIVRERELSIKKVDDLVLEIDDLQKRLNALETKK